MTNAVTTGAPALRPYFLRHAGIAFVIGFVGATLFDAVMARSTLPFSATLFFAIIFAIPVFPYLVFRDRGPRGLWPTRGEFLTRTNDFDLPVIIWREGNVFMPPRKVEAWPEADGQLVFGLVTATNNTKPSGLHLLLFGAYQIIFRGIVILFKSLKGEEAAVWAHTRPWAALDSFEIISSEALHGKKNDGRANDVLVAHFGSTAPMLEISNWKWSRSALSELSRLMRVEFLENRDAHMTRIAEAIRASERAGRPSGDDGGSKPASL